MSYRMNWRNLLLVAILAGVASHALADPETTLRSRSGIVWTGEVLRADERGVVLRTVDGVDVLLFWTELAEESRTHLARLLRTPFGPRHGTGEERASGPGESGEGTDREKREGPEGGPGTGTMERDDTSERARPGGEKEASSRRYPPTWRRSGDEDGMDERADQTGQVTAAIVQHVRERLREIAADRSMSWADAYELSAGVVAEGVARAAERFRLPTAETAARFRERDERLLIEIDRGSGSWLGRGPEAASTEEADSWWRFAGPEDRSAAVLARAAECGLRVVAIREKGCPDCGGSGTRGTAIVGEPPCSRCRGDGVQGVLIVR